MSVKTPSQAVPASTISSRLLPTPNQPSSRFVFLLPHSLTHSTSFSSSRTMRTFASILAFAATANATCAPGQWNTAWNDALLCDQEQCAVQCLGNAGCTTNCMLARNPTYDKCGVTCASNAAGCGLSQCFSQCLAGCNQNCVNCTAPRFV
jgi:hypothetical protein